MYMTRRRRWLVVSGFTLIELLVVISIIALLLAVLIPSLNRAKKQAAGVTCMSNLKQISLGYMLYQSEHKSMPEYSDKAYYSGNIHWAGALRGYYSNVEEIRLCPLAKKIDPAASPISSGSVSQLGDTFFAWRFDTSGTLGFELGNEEISGMGSYGENSWVRKPGVMADSAVKQLWDKYSLNGQAGSRMPLVFDSRWITLGVQDNDPIPQAGRADTLAPYCIGNNAYRVQAAGMRRHREGINMFFLDWSGRNVEVEELWNLKWTRSYVPKGRQEMGWVIR